MNNFAEGLAELTAFASSVNERKEEESSVKGIKEVAESLENFQECVRYLNTRRSKGAILKLDSEASVQDAVFLMLRPWINDLKSENPVDKVGPRYSISDFISPSNQLFIEIKYIRDKSHGKSVSKELHDDIEMYRHHGQCKNIIFFVYDPNGYIPELADLKRSIESKRTYDDVELKCRLIVRP